MEMVNLTPTLPESRIKVVTTIYIRFPPCPALVVLGISDVKPSHGVKVTNKNIKECYAVMTAVTPEVERLLVV